MPARIRITSTASESPERQIEHDQLRDRVGQRPLDFRSSRRTGRGLNPEWTSAFETKARTCASSSTTKGDRLGIVECSLVNMLFGHQPPRSQNLNTRDFADRPFLHGQRKPTKTNQIRYGHKCAHQPRPVTSPNASRRSEHPHGESRRPPCPRRGANAVNRRPATRWVRYRSCPNRRLIACDSTGTYLPQSPANAGLSNSISPTYRRDSGCGRTHLLSSPTHRAY